MIDAVKVEQGLNIETAIAPPPNSVEAAIIENTQGTEKAPSHFREAVGKIADAWFDPKSFEQDPKVYERLGVRAFKKYMPTTGDLAMRLYKKFGASNLIEGGSERSLRDYESFTRLYESTHVTCLAIGVAFATEALQAGRLDQVAYLATVNTLINVYPIMVQRYNRSRLYKAINRAHINEARNETRELSSDSTPLLKNNI